MAASGNPLRVVVFGGIGSGKSVFAEKLGSRGALVINADRVGHEVLARDEDAIAAVASRWPQVLEAGTIDRAALGAIVFTQPDELTALERITHPAIARSIRRQIKEDPDRDVVVELPVIRDFLGEEWVWVLVDAPAEVRLERAVARGGERADIEARMAAQAQPDVLYARADWVVANTGSIEELDVAADELWSHLTGVE